MTGALVVYTLAPIWVALGPSGERLLPRDPWDEVNKRMMAVCAGLWFFVFGATIGSFLNVVAYRMPIGLTIVAKPSRCPYCMTPILFWHNVPILGWMALRGRCYRCRLPISPRYPLVEIVMGIMFFSLFCALVVSGGANLPFRTPNSRSGVMWNLFTPQWDLIGLYFVHAYLLGTLAAIALIKFDRNVIPWKLFLFSVAVGLGCQGFWPALVSVPALEHWPAWLPLRRLVEPLLGLVFGFALGTLVQSVIRRQTNARGARTSRCGSVVIYGLVGLFLGWQSVVPVLLLASLVELTLIVVTSMGGRPADRLWATSATIVTWIVLCFWRQLSLVWLPGPTTSAANLTAGAVFGLGMVYVAQSISPDHRIEADNASDDAYGRNAYDEK